VRAFHLLVAFASLLSASPAPAQNVHVVASVTASISVRERAIVSPSDHVAVFVVPDGGDSAATDVDFTAAARALPQAVLVLAIDAGPLTATGLAGAFGRDGELTFETQGASGLQGPLVPDGRTDVATWTGGGRRAGRVRLVLRGVSPGTYRLPVHLVFIGKS
jgi:hypothetical protein